MRFIQTLSLILPLISLTFAGFKSDLKGAIIDTGRGEIVKTVDDTYVNDIVDQLQSLAKDRKIDVPAIINLIAKKSCKAGASFLNLAKACKHKENLRTLCKQRPGSRFDDIIRNWDGNKIMAVMAVIQHRIRNHPRFGESNNINESIRVGICNDFRSIGLSREMRDYANTFDYMTEGEGGAFSRFNKQISEFQDNIPFTIVDNFLRGIPSVILTCAGLGTSLFQC